MDDINYTSSSSDVEKESKAPSSDALSDMIGRLMSNPELMSIIGSMAAKTPKPSEEESRSESYSAEAVSTAAPAFSENAARLPEMISALSPMLSGIASIKSNAPAKLSPKDQRRVCLLEAIKPYVSRGRGEAIDYMIQLSRITELMKNLS